MRTRQRSDGVWIGSGMVRLPRSVGFRPEEQTVARQRIEKAAHVRGNARQRNSAPLADFGGDPFFLVTTNEKFQDGCACGIEAEELATAKVENHSAFGAGHGSDVLGQSHHGWDTVVKAAGTGATCHGSEPDATESNRCSRLFP